MDSDSGNLHPPHHVEEVLGRREICRASDRAPHVPVAGAPTVSMFHEKLRADVLFLDDIVALHVTDVSSKNSPLIPVRSENPQKRRAVFSILWVGICGPRKRIRMDE